LVAFALRVGARALSRRDQAQRFKSARPAAVIHCRFGLFERLDVHEENHAGRILSVPELLDLAVEIELERVRNFCR